MGMEYILDAALPQEYTPFPSFFSWHLNSKSATGGKVVRLWQGAQTMMLHCLKNILHSHPFSPGISWSSLSSLGPDFIKTWDNECSSFNLQGQSKLTVNNLICDLFLSHFEHLFSINSPHIVHLVKTSSVSRRESLNTSNFSCQSQVSSPLDGKTPLLSKVIPLQLQS